MSWMKSYINPDERREADRQLPKLMVEGLMLGGTGLGVLALIFEIAADAFSVAAYQTLLAIHGADGYHEIAVLAFMALSVMLFWGIVPAYKAGAYLRPDAGGSGPLVEAIGPSKLRWLSWGGTSLFFLDAVLTIIISSISAADVTMLFLPELAAYRILLAELYAFFIMAVLVAVGPKRAVPLFLLGGGLFTIFTIGALTVVGLTATTNPEWAFLTGGIVEYLQESDVVEEVVRAQKDLSALSQVVFFQLFFRSMSSAMLGFSGYEVIPASGKHAARPKWKVINTALTLAAIFLIGTGVLQLYAAKQWKIPATEGYSTLLIEYEIVSSQVFGDGVDIDELLVDGEIVVSDANLLEAEQRYEKRQEDVHHSDDEVVVAREDAINEIAQNMVIADALDVSTTGTPGESLLIISGVLLAIILLLAQGGGYVGGAAVAANAARLGRLPHYFLDDRIGITVIWLWAAIAIPIIREVVVVEAYYAFGFVSAFIITSTTVFLVRQDVLKERGIEAGEAKSLRFAGFRGMVASYIMGVVLITQKTDALGVIIGFGVIITLVQVYNARGGLKKDEEKLKRIAAVPGQKPDFSVSGIQRAHDQARQRGLADLVNHLLHDGSLLTFDVSPRHIRNLTSYIFNIDKEYFTNGESKHGERPPEPSLDLETVYQDAFAQREQVISVIELYSNYGIFTFVDKYYFNWIYEDSKRDADEVKQAMLQVLFPMTDKEEIWEQYQNYDWGKQPEPIWQFSRRRYQWAKNQWMNLSGRITTVWILQDLGLVDKDIDVKAVIAVNALNELREVEIHTHGGGHPELDTAETEAIDEEDAVDEDE
jgi:hypothetical protein